MPYDILEGFLVIITLKSYNDCKGIFNSKYTLTKELDLGNEKSGKINKGEVY